jgi:hypothetical protein
MSHMYNRQVAALHASYVSPPPCITRRDARARACGCMVTWCGEGCMLCMHRRAWEESFLIDIIQGLVLGWRRRWWCFFIDTEHEGGGGGEGGYCYRYMCTQAEYICILLHLHGDQGHLCSSRGEGCAGKRESESESARAREREH